MPFRRLPALGSLRAFEAAARHTSFKAAATELSVTPGAVSQRVKLLEEDLGVSLFERGPRGVSLTDAGRQLQPTLTTAFMRMRDAVDAVRARERAPLRLDSSGPIIRKWLLPRLHRLYRAAPDARAQHRLDRVVGGAWRAAGRRQAEPRARTGTRGCTRARSARSTYSRSRAPRWSSSSTSVRQPTCCGRRCFTT